MIPLGDDSLYPINFPLVTVFIIAANVSGVPAWISAERQLHQPLIACSNRHQGSV